MSETPPRRFMTFRRWLLLDVLVLATSTALVLGALAMDHRRARLHEAVVAGDLQAAARLIELGADVDLQLVHAVAPNHRATPLHLAASTGQVDMVRLLLASGANVNARDPRSATPLMLAAAANADEVLHNLLDAGADVTATDAWGGTALHFAAAAGAERATTVLLDAGADLTLVGANWGSVIEAALGAARPSIEFIRSLVARGADPFLGDPSGVKALIVAVESQDLAKVRFVLELGADVNAAPTGTTTPLMTAAIRHPNAVPLLLAAGASPDARDAAGHTALDIAVQWLHVDAVRALLDAGADPVLAPHQRRMLDEQSLPNAVTIRALLDAAITARESSPAPGP